MTLERCPTCRGPMVFHAITTGKNGWRRWVECLKCSEAKNVVSFVSMTEHGDVDVAISTPPPKSMLARNEEYGERD